MNYHHVTMDMRRVAAVTGSSSVRDALGGDVEQ